MWRLKNSMHAREDSGNNPVPILLIFSLNSVHFHHEDLYPGSRWVGIR